MQGAVPTFPLSSVGEVRRAPPRRDSLVDGLLDHGESLLLVLSIDREVGKLAAGHQERATVVRHEVDSIDRGCAAVRVRYGQEMSDRRQGGVPSFAEIACCSIRTTRRAMGVG